MTLSPDVRGWPADAIEAREERAAILEFDANLPRAEAEARATDIVRRQWSPTSAAPPLSTELRKPGPQRK